MYSFKIMLAGKVVAVNAIYESTVKYCKDYLTDSSDADIEVSVAPDDLEYEREKSRAELTQEELSHLTDRYYELTAVYRKIAESLVDYNIILFHGSCLAVDGEAFIFTAKSGTGKSTHTQLWCREFAHKGAYVLNDDKPAVRLMDDGVFYAYGTPWCGKATYSPNRKVPIGGICVLRRGEENRIRLCSKKEAIFALLGQTSHPKGELGNEKILELLNLLLQKVPVWHLECNMEPEAAHISYNAMSEKERNE